MSDKDFTATISVDQTPEEAFNAINNVRGWWSENIEGSTDKLGAEFTYRYQDVHLCKLKIADLIPVKKVVWHVLDNRFRIGFKNHLFAQSGRPELPESLASLRVKILPATFVEQVLPGRILRKLTDEEMSVYRAPFPTPDSRRPTWRFPNELPIAGKPADVSGTLEKAHRALVHSTYPKLLFTGNPGVLVSPTFAESFTKGLKSCRVVHLGAGRHYLQEDHAEIIGATVNEWLIDCGIGSSPKHKVAS